MFQCHSPKSSHPRPLPQSPKDCSIHLCLFCCLAYRVIIKGNETQKVPECFTNDGGIEPVGSLARNRCNHGWVANSSSHKHNMVPPPSRPFLCLWDRCLRLPINWMGICTLAFLTPQMNIVPNNQTPTVPLAAHMPSKRVIQFIPLLASLGIMAGIGMGIGIASSTTSYHTLSKDFTDNIGRVAKSSWLRWFCQIREV